MIRWIAVLLVACGGDKSDPPVTLPVPTDDTHSEPVDLIEDVAADASFHDTVFGHFKRGRGCSVVDIDDDGLQDMFLANPADESYFLLNKSSGPGDLHFVPGPVLNRGEFVWGGAAADYDNDGDVDIFLIGGGLEGREFDRLMSNTLAQTGELGFEDVSAEAGILGPIDPLGTPHELASGGALWLDYDGDGDLDLWVDGHTAPVSGKLPDPKYFIGYNVLWQNQGDGTFVDVAEEAGLYVQGPTRFSSWLDIDGDGDLDLYENNFRVAPNRLWRNNNGVFEDVTAAFGLEGADLQYPPESFVSAAADFNNDGFDDLLVFVRGYATDGPFLDGHVLLLNAGGSGFVDASAASKINTPFLSGFRDHLSLGVMGATPADLNLDGYPDVFVGNGGPGGGYPNQLFVTRGVEEVSFGSAGTLMVPQFENMSAGIETAATEVAGLVDTWPSYPYRTHAGCVADFDRDGLAELAVMNGGMSWFGGLAVQEPNRLFRYTPAVAASSISVLLRGNGTDVPFTPAGARIAVAIEEDGAERTVWDAVRTQNGFAAQHGIERLIGLGQAERIVSLEVYWPDGTQETHTDIELGERVVLTR